MRYRILFFIFMGSAYAFTPFLSFSASKSELVKLYSQYRILPLSGHKYRFEAQSCSVDGFVDGLGAEPEMILWRHMVPETIMGQNMECMDHKICHSTFSNRYFKGPRCCRQLSKKFHNMSSDLHNIIPTVLKEGKDDLIQVKKIVHKGIVARIYLYMVKQYDLSLDAALLKKMQQWHKEYPVSSWEKSLNQKIYQLQGTFNPYIEKL